MTTVVETPRPPGPTCRTCGAPILWAFTRGGMRVPVDPDPVAGGNLQLDDEPGGLVATYVQAEPDVVRHVSHFATCPDADYHRHLPTRRRGR